MGSDATAIDCCHVCGEPFREYDVGWWWEEGGKPLCRHFNYKTGDPSAARITELEAALAAANARAEAAEAEAARLREENAGFCAKDDVAALRDLAEAKP